MRQLTSLDAQFLAVETPRTYGHVGGLAVYDPSTAPGGKLELKDVCKLVSERLHLLPPFRWRLVEVPFGLDHPYWVEDPDFDIDFHIREAAIPPPGDDRSLAEVVARIFARPLDRSRPLWELYLIHGLAERARGHAHQGAPLGGGRRVGRGDPERAARPGARGPRDPRRPRRSTMASACRAISRCSAAAWPPCRAGRCVRCAPSHRRCPTCSTCPEWDACPGCARSGARPRGCASSTGAEPTDARVLEMQTARVPRTRFNGPISAHRRYAFGSISLDTVKALKNELGITVNDVVVTLCATAVRDWLDRARRAA